MNPLKQDSRPCYWKTFLIDNRLSTHAPIDNELNLNKISMNFIDA